MKVGLIITTYNRPQYLRECLDSVKRTSIKKEDVLIVDDDSSNQETKKLIRESGYEVLWKLSRSGIKNSLIGGYLKMFDKGYDLVINLDADAILRNDAIEVLVGLKKRFPDNLVGGFNTTVKNRNPIISYHADHFIKKYLSGICCCINRDEYEKYLLPALYTPIGNWDFMASQRHESDGKGVVVSRPSVCQHIGIHESAMGHISVTEPPDVAEDFKPLHLPDVTLIGAVGNWVKEAIDISTRNIFFGAVKIIPPLNSKEEYSKLVLKKLTHFFDTEYCLLIQHDGFVVNWKAWDNGFYGYDYIGATWPWYKDKFRVGNGGFSLRSKRLCDILAKDENIIPKNDMFIKHFQEDHNICRIYRDYLERIHHIKFAPEDVANRFSVEAWGLTPPGNRYNGQFGFHGGYVDFGSGNYKTLKNAN